MNAPPSFSAMHMTEKEREGERRREQAQSYLIRRTSGVVVVASAYTRVLTRDAPMSEIAAAVVGRTLRLCFFMEDSSTQKHREAAQYEMMMMISTQV